MTPSLFRRLLGPGMDALPQVLREVHDAGDMQVWEGRADVTVSRNPVARGLCRIMRLPAAGLGVPVSVRFERHGTDERWHRCFAGRSYQSRLSAKDGLLVEHMGPATNLFRVSQDGPRISLDLVGFRFLGIALPSALRPRCRAEEREADGRYVFDIPVSLPWLGFVIRYTGSMERADV